MREIGRFEQLGDRFFRNVDPDALSVAVDRDGFRLVDHDRLPDRSGVFDRFAVDVDDLIAVAETHFPGQIVVDVAVFDVLVVEVGLSPRIAHPDVDEYGEQDIHQHAADHDQQSLPGRFRPELVRLDGLFHLVGVHRLVDHPGDFHVAAERNPADTVFGAPLFELEKREPRVEKQVEFFDARLEQPREPGSARIRG